MENRFDFKSKEEAIYEKWEKNGYFKVKKDRNKKPFVISMPPPNVTAKLHIGHALDGTIPDVFIRYHRLKGDPTLWVPGTDHASIATEVKVVEKLKKEGKSKDSLGREAFLKEAWEWKEKYGGEIIAQQRKLGCSCDWDRARFTMDEGCSDAVLEVFERLYKEGLIYKGERLVNWCTNCKTPISDTEVEYEEQNSYLWHIRYPVQDSEEFVVVATTRPETMLGDTAVAVNPSDKRYAHLVGKQVLLPIVNKYIPVIADHYVDKEFGTGAVKITSAHDPNDFKVGERHQLPVINILNEDGTLNENGYSYQGLTMQETREKIVQELEEQKYLVKVEPHVHNVGSCYRCHNTIEPFISNQWFVKMQELVKPAIETVKKKETQFIPKRFEKTYFNWMENIEDWCISRQLWWGHRIPAYYCQKCGKIIVSKTPVTHCECGGEVIQDEDTLDTWFSSALWPFSILGWPKETEDLEYFYPNTMLITGYDIITFWVSKMIFSGLHYTGKTPFSYVYIHGLVRDAQGRKMSKSLGNGVDPMEIIEVYGTDALRFSLIQNISAGNDIRFMTEKVEASRNFGNKLWNAARFVHMYIEDLTMQEPQDLRPGDQWILTRLTQVEKEVVEDIDKFEIGIALQKIYDFIWSDFCDNYIEIAKVRLYNKDDSYQAALWTLNHVLIAAIKMLHPYMPFITEEIYQNLKTPYESIMLDRWPEDDFDFEEEVAAVEDILEMLKQVRNVRADSNVIASRKINAQVIFSNEKAKIAFELTENFIKKLGFIFEIEYITDEKNVNKEYFALHTENISMYLNLNDVVDKEAELKKIKEKKEEFLKELKRAKGMLANKNFIDKAPAHLVEAEEQKVLKYEDLLDKIEKRMERIK